MRPYLIALFIALPSILFAQSNYHSGYVVKNNDDTLKGFINYREWDQCPKSIDFKINKEDRQTLKFDPHIIKSFQINGMESYVTYKGIISMDRTKFPDLPQGLDTTKKQDTIFLKQITTGKYLSLFYHQDGIKIRLFIAVSNEQPLELKYLQYYSAQNQVVSGGNYKAQLTFFINRIGRGSNKLTRLIEDAGYNQSDFEKIVSEANGDGLNTKSDQKKVFFRFFAGARISNTKNNLSDDRSSISSSVLVGPIREVTVSPQKISAFSSTQSPEIDLGIDLFPNKNVQQFIFRAALSLWYAKPRFQYLVYDGSINDNYLSTTFFSQYTATLTPQVLFNFYNKDRFKIYIDGGIGLNFSSYSNSKLRIGTVNDFDSFWPNFPVQAGIIIAKKWDFSVTYSGYADYTKFAGDYGLRSSSASVGVKYLFGK
ncbi:MAG TPA: hypothetical protein VL442_05245 [Mucilaginibacter sp.]|jgi:hypothetical protein|nr:hypothetical protein [Mucilaginibacter sp.]